MRGTQGTGKLRNQVFVYQEYLALLDEGTELTA
jgi:hypothetical protein